MRRAVAAPRLGARALRRAARVLDGLGGGHAAAIEETMARHDMAGDADERYYLKQYLHWLEPVLERLEGRGAVVVDPGCGQGRLTLAVAERLRDATVVGVDPVESVLAAARGHASAQGHDNIQLVRADAAAHLAGLAPASIELILFTEVSFWMPRYDAVLVQAARVLASGGTLFAAFRPQYHNLVQRVAERDLAGARAVRDTRRGRFGDSPVEQTWQTGGEIEARLLQLGFELEPLRGIGILSGLATDAFGRIARPSVLPPDDREQLLDLELSLAEQYPENGRYVLATARRQR